MATEKKAQDGTGSVSVEAVGEREEENNHNHLLPNFLLSVRLKYVKLGYHYLINHTMYLFLAPVLATVSVQLFTLKVDDLIQLWTQLKFNLVTVLLCSALVVFLATLYFMSRPRQVYLVDFACYKAEPKNMCRKQMFMDRSRRSGAFTEENLSFQKKILERSGLGQTSYCPEVVLSLPPNQCMAEARKEAEKVMFVAIDELLEKTGED